VKLDQLAVLCEKHKWDKNYQHRDKTWEEIDSKAGISFLRLPKEQQQKVLAVCKKYDLVDLNLIARYRFMAQTNLFFLCKLLEKYKDTSDKEYVWTDGTVHNTHEEICNEFFVRKDPTIATFKEFANTYEDKKERLLLVPRGGFKSSMDMADCVQWIICWSESTILVLTGVLDLAKDFVGEIKGHFELEDGDAKFADLFHPKKAYRPKTTPDGSPSMFQVLFPEHCVPKEDGQAHEYWTPACNMPDKEPTVFAGSIEQSLTGWHVGILKLDDVVTNENSQTVDRLKNVNKQVSINQAMLHPYGFYDKIGTWYDSEDVYGHDIKNEKKFLEDGETAPMKIYIRPCWWPTAAAVLAGKIEEEMTETDYVLWFNEPGQLTYKFLRNKKKTDPWFAIKYLNDPTQLHVVKFPRELLIRRTINANDLPDSGMIVTTVDTAYSTKQWADYTVIITALIYGGRFYVIDMKRGRYNEYELPAMIAATALNWKPKRICIEESVGVKWMGRECYREMDKLKIRVPIEFVSLGLGNKANSKAMKAKPVLRYLGDDRLRFVNSCPGLEELYEELSKFGTAASTHDDIVDALAILINQFSSYADIEGKMAAQSSGFAINPGSKHFHEVVFGNGKPNTSSGKFNPATNSYELNNAGLEFPDTSMSELADNMAKDNSFQDPLADLMG
jgi:phage terminase large subunit-like protein